VKVTILDDYFEVNVVNPDVLREFP